MRKGQAYPGTFTCQDTPMMGDAENRHSPFLISDRANELCTKLPEGNRIEGITIKEAPVISVGLVFYVGAFIDIEG